MELTPWRNGSASDSRSEGCVFESRRSQLTFFVIIQSAIKPFPQRSHPIMKRVKRELQSVLAERQVRMVKDIDLSNDLRKKQASEMHGT